MAIAARDFPPLVLASLLMLPAPSYQDVLASLRSYMAPASTDRNMHLVGIMFCQPYSRFAKEAVLPGLRYFHYRSGEHVNFYFAGYRQDYEAAPGEILALALDDGPGWVFSASSLNAFGPSWSVKRHGTTAAAQSSSSQMHGLIQSAVLPTSTSVPPFPSRSNDSNMKGRTQTLESCSNASLHMRRAATELTRRGASAIKQVRHSLETHSRACLFQFYLQLSGKTPRPPITRKKRLAAMMHMHEEWTSPHA